MKRGLFIFFFSLVFSSDAQVAGYMGKRFIVGVENSISPNFPVLLYLDNPVYLGPIISTAGRMDYVLSDRRALSICARYVPRRFDIDHYDGIREVNNRERLNMMRS